MEFDIWFYNQKKILQIILLLLPLVGWIVEILVRLSIMLKDEKFLNIGIFGIILLFGWMWIIVLVDMVYLIIKWKLLFS